MIYMLWHGGPNYLSGGMESIEEFPSMRAAVAEFARRRNCGGYYPCVENSSAQLFFYDPRNVNDPYPDKVIIEGPRRGVRVEIA